MILWSVIAVLIIFFDQISKILVVSNIELNGAVQVIPGLFSFTYVKNTGAAFSMLSSATWILSAISVAFCIGLVIYCVRKKPQHIVLRIALVMLFAGAFGNAIDRIFLGYVVDFIQTEFMSFPVFNVADISITLGAVLMIIYSVFFDKGDRENG